MEVKKRIREFIRGELYFQPPNDQDLTDDYPLLAAGVIDSLGIFQLVSFLQSQFRVTIPNDELRPDHFASIESIARLVESKHAQG